MQLDKISGEYFNWLCDLVGINAPDNSYFLLAQKLHSYDFFELVKNDDNRRQDGLLLRRDFCYEIAGDNPIKESLYLNELNKLEGECSIFEMLVAFADRIHEDFTPDDNHDSVYWFWEMMTNLELDEYNDEDYYDRNANYYIDVAVDKFVNRKYRANGYGGLFPLDHSKQNQRKAEIWYQMTTYLMEKNLMI